MAGGTFTPGVQKKLPGVYINFESQRQEPLGQGKQGIVTIPIINHNYGPAKEFIRIPVSSIDSAIQKLGYSVFDKSPATNLIRQAAMNASEILAYIPAQGTNATGTAGGLTGTAVYGGSRGNDLRWTVTAVPDGTFEVYIYLDTALKGIYQGVTTAEEVSAISNGWIVFSGSGELSEVSGVKLTGGTDGEATAADIAEYLDKSEAQQWNTMAFPLVPVSESGDMVPALQEALRSKMKYLWDNVGKYRKAVVANFAADHESITNVTNSPGLPDGTDISLAEAVAWAAGLDAGSSDTTSNTEVVYPGATRIVGEKTSEETEEAVGRGEFFFSMSEDNNVVVTYDINSLVTFEKPKDNTYRKNRVIRVLANFATDLKINFKPNQFSNSPIDWKIEEGLGRALLSKYQERGAIKNVEDGDFLVDQSASDGDYTYYNVGLQAVDSTEKSYFHIKTR